MLAPASKVIPFRVTLEESETLVVLEASKVAISERPSGTVAGVQLAAVFQSPLVGLRFQVALPAIRETGLSNKPISPANLRADSSRANDFIRKKVRRQSSLLN
jgi:hypothetical protein